MALLIWVVMPETAFAGSALILIGAVQAIRMMRWRGWRVWSDPLVAMLHVAFGFVAAGMVTLGLAPLSVLTPAAGFHLLGIGGFGCMTLAVMMRALLGHTGRELQAGPALTLAFLCVGLAALARVFVPVPSGLWIAAALWTAGFAVFVWQFTPVLTLANPARRQPNGR